MDPWKDAEEILKLVQDEHNWTPKLFERCRNNTLVSPCIFNQIRKVLSADQYQRFDDAYCLHGRPEQKGMIQYFRRERLQKEGEKDKWQKMTRHDLLQSSDRQLLSLLSQLKESGQL